VIEKVDADNSPQTFGNHMNQRMRNRLTVLVIMAFPFIVLLGFIFSESVAPLPLAQPQPNTNNIGTNMVYSPR
jgi:hypothetical protein